MIVVLNRIRLQEILTLLVELDLKSGSGLIRTFVKCRVRTGEDMSRVSLSR